MSQTEEWKVSHPQCSGLDHMSNLLIDDEVLSIFTNINSCYTSSIFGRGQMGLF